MTNKHHFLIEYCEQASQFGLFLCFELGNCLIRTHEDKAVLLRDVEIRNQFLGIDVIDGSEGLVNA